MAAPTEEVLHPDTLEEMCQPQIMADPERWQPGFKLGFMLVRSGPKMNWATYLVPRDPLTFGQWR